MQAPSLAELQVWLFRRGLADYTRVFLACGIRAMTDLYELNHTKLTNLLIKDVGLNRRQADGIIKELMVRRDLLGYTSTDLITNQAEMAALKDKKQRDDHRQRTLGRRDWHNRLEVAGDAHGPTYHDTRHKPVSCFMLPAPIGRVDAARERAQGRRHPQDVQVQRRSQIAPTAGNTRNPLSPYGKKVASIAVSPENSESWHGLNSFASTGLLSLRPNLEESWSLPDISSTSLVASSPTKSLRTSPNKSPNMFATVSPGGRRRSSKGLQQGFSQHRRVSRSPTRVDPRFASLSPERRSRLYQQLESLDADASLGASLAIGDGSDGGGSAMVPFDGGMESPSRMGQPKTMQEWLRHTRQSVPEEYYMAGCPGL